MFINEAKMDTSSVESDLHLNGIRQHQLLVLHQVGYADAGRTAAAVLAVHHSAPPAGRLLVDGVGAAVEVAVDVLIGVVVHRNVQPLDGVGGKRLLFGHVDAERHRLLLDELDAASRAGVANEQTFGDLTELQHPGPHRLRYLGEVSLVAHERGGGKGLAVHVLTG